MRDRTPTRRTGRSRNSEDLTARSQLIEHATAAGGTLVLLVKEIGSDALFALLRTLEGAGREKALAYWQRCVDGDLAVCVGQTDVKGNRRLGPEQQDDPDMYVHVVDRGPDGIVVRGAKVRIGVGERQRVDRAADPGDGSRCSRLGGVVRRTDRYAWTIALRVVIRIRRR